MTNESGLPWHIEANDFKFTFPYGSMYALNKVRSISDKRLSMIVIREAKRQERLDKIRVVGKCSLIPTRYAKCTCVPCYRIRASDPLEILQTDFGDIGRQVTEQVCEILLQMKELVGVDVQKPIALEYCACDFQIQELSFRYSFPLTLQVLPVSIITNHIPNDLLQSLEFVLRIYVWIVQEIYGPFAICVG